MSSAASPTAAIVFGTRPEIIKLAPLAKLLGDRAVLVHTGQHFDNELSSMIARDMGITLPPTTLGVGARSRAAQIGESLMALEQIAARASAVVVQGDTNSALAGGLAANARNVPLFHVEAGLRSYDRRMPEEHNRVLIDHIADMCWAPTSGNVQNLRAEGIPSDRVFETGNSIVEALGAVTPSDEDAKTIQGQHGLRHRGYILVTLHRPENVDDPARLASLLENLARLSLPVVFPIHPRTQSTIESAGASALLDGLTVIPPVGYRDFLGLLQGCRLVISDSGGVQEEVSILKVPMVVVRRSTERPEVLGTFASLTDDPDEMLHRAADLIERGDEVFLELEGIPSPYGDGLASQRMVESLEPYLAT